jgi:RHS repeat-associated protein
VDDYAVKHSGSTLYLYDITQRDTNGRIKKITETAAGTTINKSYDYDPSDRLWRVFHNGTLVREYGYDLNGNRTHLNGQIIGVYDDRDRLSSYNGAVYTYQTTGEVATKTVGTQVTRYYNDAFNNLTRVELPDGTAIDYLADSLGRRVIKKLNGSVVQGFLYGDALNPVAELNGAGQMVARFVYGTREHVPDYMLKDGKTYRLISDHLGSVRLVVDISSGHIAQRMDYDEFGVVLSDSSPGFQPFGYEGGIYDSHTGLVRFGARDYEAGTGRWVQSDPIGFDAGQTNLYVYIDSDPINYFDIEGTVKDSVTASLESAIARGDVKKLQSMMEALNPGQRKLAEQALKRLNSKAGDLIPGSLKRSNSYRSEMSDWSYEQICRTAKGSGADAKAAKQMKKLIEQSSRLQEKIRGG